MTHLLTPRLGYLPFAQSRFVKSCFFSPFHRHMPKTVEESLLGDHSDQWIDTDCPEAKRLKVGAAVDGWCRWLV